MLKQEVINRLAALAKISADDLAEAIKDAEEKDVTIDANLQVFTEQEVTTLKNNEYKSGKEKGVEMAVKEVKEKQGLEFQGKTIDSLIEAAQNKALADAKIEPEKKVQELTEKLTNLQKTAQEYESKIAAKDQEVQSIRINSELMKYIPAMSETGPALGADDVIQLMKISGYEFKLEDGKTVAYKDGKVLTDNLSANLQPKDVVTSFLKEKKLITEEPTPPGGRGGKDGKQGSGYGKLSELEAKWKEEGKNVLGSEFAAEAQRIAKENPEFKMDQ